MGQHGNPYDNAKAESFIKTVSIAEGCRLMGIGRSTFYDTPDARARDLTIVAEMKTICDEFEAYGYRRVDAELRHRGIVVNAKKIRRLMHEHALNPKQRRRFIATTDSDHNYPIFPNLAKNMKLDGPNQLWVADITYVTTSTRPSVHKSTRLMSAFGEPYLLVPGPYCWF